MNNIYNMNNGRSSVDYSYMSVCIKLQSHREKED